MRGEFSLEPLMEKTIINEYEFVKCLDQSAFEITYLCRDLNLSRDCIIKEYAPFLACTRTSDQSLFPINEQLFLNGYSEFISIAQRIALFDHPNIVHIYDIFKTNGSVYYSMEYIKGEVLSRILEKRDEPLEEVEIFAFLYPFSNAILTLHKKEILHRNICPDNIMIREDNSPVLIDFGMSTDTLNTFRDEENKRVLGTNDFSSPEMFDPGVAKQTYTDVYSFAAVLYRMISGKDPVSGDKRVKEDTLMPAMEAGRGKYTRRLLQIIDDCMHTNPHQRCPYMNEIIIDFDAYNYKEVKNEYANVLHKAFSQFLNFAEPNEGLYTDEFITILIGFGIIDLTWRMTQSNLINQVLFEKLVDQDLINNYLKLMEEKGFTCKRRMLTPEILKSRLEEYAAAYLLDRQQEEWTLSLLVNQCAKYCLANEIDEESFKELIFEVIDRYRGRMKKIIRHITEP